MHIPFNRFLVIRNPKSTNVSNTARYIAQLERAFPDVEITVIDTVAGGPPANAKMLRPYAKLIDKKTLLCIASGDGTVGMVINILLSDLHFPAAARKATLLPLWCGNANDLAHMLNGNARTPLELVVKKGAIVPVYPLECSLTYQDGTTEKHLAGCYASFGASAHITKILSESVRKNTVLHRLPSGRLIEELIVTSRALFSAMPFEEIEDGHSSQIFERVFFNGPRCAKIGRIQQQLTDKSFHQAIIYGKRFLDIMWYTVEIMRGSRTERYKRTHAAFTIASDAWMQFDGEATVVPAGTRVEVRVASQPFYALSTKECAQKA